MKIFKFDSIDSTNIFLKNLKEKQEYDVAIAKTQTLGRGRRGNKWFSEEGGAYFSFLLKEDKNIDFEKYTKLSLVAGYSLMKTLEKIEPKLNFMFKWTNDIYLFDKKLSGILIEKVGEYFIIGIGLNINNKIKDDIKKIAISLKEITLKEYKIEEIILLIIENFKKDLTFYLTGNWDKILLELNIKNYLYNKNIEIRFENRSLKQGKALEIHDSGQLVVNIENKNTLFNIGEIHILKSNS